MLFNFVSYELKKIYTLNLKIKNVIYWGLIYQGGSGQEVSTKLWIQVL